eukprot:15438071-Alexandrium_andersonii.AAC.1
MDKQDSGSVHRWLNMTVRAKVLSTMTVRGRDARQLLELLGAVRSTFLQAPSRLEQFPASPEA